jgi:hypothetical protein
MTQKSKVIPNECNDLQEEIRKWLPPSAMDGVNRRPEHPQKGQTDRPTPAPLRPRQ